VKDVKKSILKKNWSLLIVFSVSFFLVNIHMYIIYDNYKADNYKVEDFKPIVLNADEELCRPCRAGWLWNQTWGRDYSSCNSVWGDGTFIYTCGYTNNSGAGGNDILLVKWDLSGNELWNQTWGTSGEEFGYSVMGDGSAIYVCGRTASPGSDIVLIKWNSAGNQLWSRTWGGLYNDYGLSVWCNSTRVYVAGILDAQTSPFDDNALVKWDASGNLLWSRTWGTTQSDNCGWIWGDSVGAVYTLNWVGSGPNVTLVKWDATNGVQLWSRSSDTGSFHDNDYESSVWGDGNYIYIIGNVLFAKYDTDGNLIFNETIRAGGSLSSDGTYLYVGGYDRLTKYNSSGNLIWYRDWYDGLSLLVRSTWTDSSFIFIGGSYIGGASLYKWDVRGALPVSGFYYTNGVLEIGLTIDFYSSGWYWDGDSPATYQWDFGDGTMIVTKDNPVHHQYNSFGKYTVSLTITDVDGDSDTKTIVDYITINEPINGSIIAIVVIAAAVGTVVIFYVLKKKNVIKKLAENRSKKQREAGKPSTIEELFKRNQ
jgi:hypothetical protein